MSFSPTSSDRYLSIHLALIQYPVLSSRIRARMRRELIDQGILTQQAFETKVREMAIRSQKMEGLHNPYGEEAAEIWELRLSRIREQFTDLTYAEHFSFTHFQRLVNEILRESGITAQELISSLNPELAPAEMVFEHAMTIERMPDSERARYEKLIREAGIKPD